MTSCEPITEVIRQHFVAQTYLKSWCHDLRKGRERLWVFDKRAGTSFRKSIADIGYKRHFYDVAATLDRNHPERFQVVDKAFSPIEDGAQKSINRLISIPDRLCLTDDLIWDMPVVTERNLAFYVALQFLRTDSAREMIKQMVSQDLQLAADQTIPIHFADLITKQVNVEPTEEHVRITHMELMFELADEIMDILLRKNWLIGINSTSISLVTSDCPVSVLGIKGGPAVPFTGFEREDIQILYPLSPAVALIIGPVFAPKPARLLTRLTDADVKAFNISQLKQCQRQIYSKEQNFDFAKKLCSENPRFSKENFWKYQANPAELAEWLGTLREAARAYKAQHSQ